MNAAKKRWSKIEDEMLAQGIKEKSSYVDIGKALGRSEKSVQMRAFVLRKKSQQFAKYKPARRVAKSTPKKQDKPVIQHQYVLPDMTQIASQYDRLFLAAVISAMCSFSTMVMFAIAVLAS